jgi:hypothetical protein
MKEKGKRKIKIYFSMDPDLYEVFEKHIDENLYDKSKVIEKLIDEYIQKKIENNLIKYKLFSIFFI